MNIHAQDDTGRAAAAKPVIADAAVVTPVWGETHVRRFLDLVLPSWLAPGNLPALARDGRRPFVIVTRTRDIPLFEQSRAFAKVRALMDVSFVPMDDLLGPAGVPVTLTLAFARGMAQLADPVTPRPFALLNADFVLADGSLRSLAAALETGAEVVLAPSLRVIEEEVVGDLLLGVKDDVLILPPRELTARALRALHPTVLASRVDQSILWSANPNQLYWRPTPDLLIGRAFCLFTLAAVVKGPIPAIGCYCDYGFTEDLGAQGEPVVFGDSDRFLAVELGPLDQEQHFSQHGAPSPAVIAEKLSVWTTREHRAQARQVLLYKAADPPADLPEVIRSGDRVLDEITARLGPPQPRLEHPHWLGGVGAWRVAREYRGVTDDPAELAPTIDIRVRPAGAVLTPARGAARTLLFGDPGRRALQHPYWRLERAFKRRLAALSLSRPSVVGAGASMRLLDEADAAASDRAPEDADGVIAFMDMASAERVDHLISRLSSLPAGRPALLAVFRTAQDDLGALALADLVSGLDTDFVVEALETFDLRRDRRVELAHGRLADARSAGALPLARLGLASLVHAARLLAVNLMIAGGVKRPPTSALTAVLVMCRRRVPAAKEPSPQ